ncbi:hypothetical protein BDQ12DRAFT_696989 [Crucibulum laeve]|uniref:BZIP domain-containing protein n=1 Tax=Crucibulum laeve TaxID=68775 RepID=A0A5C3MIM8_9AGAR|nr:hypothetical protein BDQ12DRAFT_696989 [Crucibulum laeve]
MTSVTSGTQSSSILWATASKEWIIQPKPKPGRKPKDVASTVKEDGEVDSKGRRVQNRAAQRAFRERKQSQLAELQARIQSYEQGEVERNVALQNIAKRLKEENEQLRRENLFLKEKCSKLQKDKESREGEKKRWRDDSPTNSIVSDAPARKKLRPSSPNSQFPALPMAYNQSPSSMVSTPDSNGTSDAFSPISYATPPDSSCHSLDNMLDFSSSVKAICVDEHAFPTFDCGFCNEDTPCVCREIARQQAAERAALTTLKSDNCSMSQQSQPINHTERVLKSTQSSILENLPTYQAPIPLRRRTAGSRSVSVFPVHPQVSSLAPPAQTSAATCSGDPSNCMACADDPFGKAFCSAIEESVASRSACSDCPCDCTHNSSIPQKGCCGNQVNCQSCSSSSFANRSLIPPTADTKTIPTNDAWRQIKAHPNVAFADLSLLADVVASRSKCTGPRLVLSPEPRIGTIEGISETQLGNTPQSGVGEPVILTDPHARYKERHVSSTSPPLQLVPQEVLLKCGRQRVREVHTDAVRDALRLLDTKFS